MKKCVLHLVLATTVLGVALASAQNNTPWTTTGNIGIGTTSPQSNLHIRSTDAYSPQLLLDNAGGAGAGYLIFQKTKLSQAVLAPGDGLGTILSTAFANGSFQQSSYLAFSVDAPTSGSNVFGALTFVSRNADGSASEKLRVSSTGNLGVGTTSPSFKLDVVQNGYNAIRAIGNSANSVGIYVSNTAPGGRQWGLIASGGGPAPVGTFSIWDDAAQASRFNIDSTGNVGIGTSATNAKVDIHGASLQNTYSIATSSPEDLRVLSADNRSLDGGVITIGGSWGPTAYIKTAAYNGAAGAIVIGNRRNPADTTMQPGILLDTSGNVGIGTTNPTQKLSVNGTIRAKEVVVETSGWSDYVFADNYVLQPLSEVETQIKQNKHLPGIPSAQQVAENGIGLGEMQAKLLAKIEELTLHQIEQDKRIRALEAENAKLRKE